MRRTKDGGRQEIELKVAARLFLRLVSLIRPYWIPLGKGWLLGIVVGVLGMVTPFITKLLIDQVYPSRDVALMQVLVGAGLALGVSGLFIRSLRGFYTVFVSARLSSAASLMFFNHLQHLRTRFFDEHQVGEVLSRFGDVRGSLNTVTKAFETAVTGGVYLLLVPPVLFFLQWKLAILALISVPINIAIIALSGRVLRRHWKRSAEAFADLGALQVEALSNIRTFKALALEHSLYIKARDKIETSLDMQLRATGYQQLFGLGTGGVTALNTALYTWFGWSLIIQGELTLGGFIAFTSYVAYIRNPLQQLAGLFNEFQRAAVNLDRMFEYLDLPTETPPATAHHAPKAISHSVRGEVVFRRVSFGFDVARPILHEVSLSFPAGSVTAIVGPSGAGKSTLLRLINRIEDPDSGEVLADGVPVTHINLADLRRQVTAIWQETRPISGTIRENLTLGCESDPGDRLNQALAVAQLRSVVNELQDGLDSQVAEAGASLSGGQRQRLAIAGAFLRDAPILLLDEVTANIDVGTETAILEALIAASVGKTLIFVTHRLQSARLADRIVVLEQGRVVGSGSHDELAASCVCYRRMLDPADEERHSNVEINRLELRP